MKIAPSLLNRVVITLCFAVAGSLWGADDWITTIVVADGVSIKVVLPYAKTPDDNPSVVYTAKAMESTGSELLALCMSDVDARQASVDRVIKSKNYSYTPERWARDLAKQKADFDKTQTEEIKDETNKLMADILKKEAPDLDVGVSINRPVVFPISDESMRHYTSLMLFGMAVSVNGVNEKHVIVISQSTVWVGGRLLNVMINEPFVDKGSYIKVAELTKEAIRRTLAANPD